MPFIFFILRLHIELASCPIDQSILSFSLPTGTYWAMGMGVFNFGDFFFSVLENNRAVIIDVLYLYFQVFFYIIPI